MPGNYFVYITTNPDRTTLYIGVANDLRTRLRQHKENRGNRKTFAGRYHCYNLIYFERFDSAANAINREKELKKWSRIKKEGLISLRNAHWEFYDSEAL